MTVVSRTFFQIIDAFLGLICGVTPDPRRIAVIRMYLARKNGNAANARAIGERILKTFPGSPDIVGQIALAMKDPDQYRGALRLIEEYHAEQGATPELLEIGLDIANGYAGRETVTKWTDLVLSVDPKSALALNYRYQELTRSGQHEAAKEIALSVECRPGARVRPVFNTVFHLLRSDERDRAISLLSQLEGRPEFEYERTMVSALLAIESDDLARAGTLISRAARLKAADRRLAPALLILAKAHRARDTDEETQNSKKYEAWGEKVYAKPLSDTTQKKISELESKLDEIKSTRRARDLIGAQSALVSVICPVHRTQDVENIVRQVSRQSWRNAEVVFYPNGGVTKRHIHEAWDHSSDIGFVLLESADPPELGGILNEAIDASQGKYICRMDADCWYYPDYVANMICCLEHAEADVVVKATQFRYLKALESITLNTAGPSFEPAMLRNTGSGATFLFRRSVFEKARFRDLPAGEDTWFLSDTQAAGFKAHYVDPFNFVGIRAADKSEHAWKITDAQILFQQNCDVFRNSNEFHNLVRHPSMDSADGRGRSVHPAATGYR